MCGSYIHRKLFYAIHRLYTKYWGSKLDQICLGGVSVIWYLSITNADAYTVAHRGHSDGHSIALTDLTNAVTNFVSGGP